MRYLPKLTKNEMETLHGTAELAYQNQEFKTFLLKFAINPKALYDILNQLLCDATAAEIAQ